MNNLRFFKSGGLFISLAGFIYILYSHVPLSPKSMNGYLLYCRGILTVCWGLTCDGLEIPLILDALDARNWNLVP